MASATPAGRGLKQDSGRSLLFATGMLVALPLLVAAMVAGLLLLSEQETSRALDERLLSATRVTAAQVTSIVQSGRENLERADEALGDDPAAFHSLVSDAPEAGEPENGASDAGGPAQGATRVIAVFSSTGQFLPPPGLSVVQNPIGDNPDFKALAAGAAWRITPLIAQGPSGGRSFAIGHRIERGGRFAGAAVIYLSADVLVESWLSVNLGQGSTVGAIRDDGWLVTRFPVPDTASNLEDYELFTEHLPAASSGAYDAISPIDNAPRRVAYSRIEGLPLVATASMSRQLISTGFWRRVQSTALVTAPVLAALIVTCIGMILLLRRERDGSRALHSALARNQMLLQEIHHRVKNNLQTVEAMIRLQPGPIETKDELANRIRAMSAVHQHMYESDQFETLRVDTYIETLAASLRQGADTRIRVETHLNPLEMHAERAMPLGLLVNEIVQNAFKHAFPDGRSGTIRIWLEAGQDGQALLRIHDDGVGGGAGPARAGMGTRLIRGFSRQLGGEPSLSDSDGTLFELRFRIE